MPWAEKNTASRASAAKNLKSRGRGPVLLDRESIERKLPDRSLGFAPLDRESIERKLPGRGLGSAALYDYYDREAQEGQDLLKWLRSFLR